MDDQPGRDGPIAGMKASAVFGDPVHIDGITVIPAVAIRGGAGTNGSKGRSGYGLRARPAGAFVARGGRVSWRPAFDVNRIILGGQLLAITALVMSSLLFADRRRPRLRRWLRRAGFRS